MKTKRAIPIIFFCLALIFTAALTLYLNGEKDWRTEVIQQEDSSFIQLEIVDGDPNVAYSTSEGIRLAERKRTGIFPHSGTEWVKTNVTDRENSGYYLSTARIDGELAMAHQYSRLGDRKLGYTHRVNGSWETEKVDSVIGSGLETGMYASLSRINGDPVIFYHTAEDDQFLKARKTNGSWEREKLGEDTGQFISTDSCGEKVFVLYRSRESSTLHKGLLSSEGWSSEKLPGDTGGTMSVDASNCEFKAAYHNTETGQITYVDGEGSESIVEGRLSSVSLEYQGIPHLSYYVSGQGLYHAIKDSEGWKIQLIDGEREYAGERNQLDLYSESKPGIVYTAGSDIVYADIKPINPDKANILLKLLVIAVVLSAALGALYLEEELILLKSKLFKQFRV